MPATVSTLCYQMYYKSWIHVNNGIVNEEISYLANTEVETSPLKVCIKSQTQFTLPNIMLMAKSIVLPHLQLDLVRSTKNSTSKIGLSEMKNFI